MQQWNESGELLGESVWKGKLGHKHEIAQFSGVVRFMLRLDLSPPGVFYGSVIDYSILLVFMENLAGDVKYLNSMFENQTC